MVCFLSQIGGVEVNKRLLKMGWPILALFICGIAIFIERMGLKYDGQTQTFQTVSMQNEEVFSSAVEAEKECLVLVDSNDDFGEEMIFVLDDMRVGYDVVDVTKEAIPKLTAYRTIVVTFADLTLIKNDLQSMIEWVKNGGNLMNTHTFQLNSAFKVIESKLGIVEDTRDYASIDGITILNDFMIGGNETFSYDTAMDVSLSVCLDRDSKTYIESRKGHVPILWERNYGNGKFVIMNLEMTGKENRGWLSAAYTLLQDVGIYPVINASSFYIDDFPSPDPEGENEYITRDFNMSIADFYTNVWWPQFLTWEQKYHIVHTGLIIEDYNDNVEAPFYKQTDKQNFDFYGNMLLNHGGEIGIHGYNHMPLCLEGFDFKGMYDGYNQWKTKEDMKTALLEVQSFASSLYPSQKFSVYVPPSNLLSTEGREALKETLPNLKAIASVYLPDDDDCAYDQEFEVSEDGIVETPRIVSGYIISEYMKRNAYTELNFHYVQSHFVHPDDVLDQQRGANLGWKRLSMLFEKYLSWLYTSAPNIRNVTGSGMADAVKVYDALSMQKQWGENSLSISLGGFSKEAYLMMRLNVSSIKDIQGATYEHVTGNLYLLHANSDKVTITWEE